MESTSISHIIKKSALIFILTILVYISCVSFIDLPLTSFIASHTNHILIMLAKIFSLIFTPTLFFVLWLAVLVALTAGLLLRKFDSQCINYLNSCALIIIPSQIILSMLKIMIGRARPNLWVFQHISGFFPFTNTYDFFSTPSGHVMTVSALVFVVCGFTKKTWLKVLAYIGLVLMALSRMVLLKHFLGDCLFSIGFIWFCFSYRIYIYNKIFGLIPNHQIRTDI